MSHSPRQMSNQSPINNFTDDLSESQEIFSLYDRDSDGLIAPHMVITALRAVGLNPAEVEAQKLVEEVLQPGDLTLRALVGRNMYCSYSLLAP